MERSPLILPSPFFHVPLLQKKNEEQMAGMAQIAMQRTVTEWLRHDSLWEDGFRGVCWVLGGIWGGFTRFYGDLWWFCSFS